MTDKIFGVVIYDHADSATGIHISQLDARVFEVRKVQLFLFPKRLVHHCPKKLFHFSFNVKFYFAVSAKEQLFARTNNVARTFVPMHVNLKPGQIPDHAI